MYYLSEEESDRIKIIKFIAIVFVVYIHSYSGEMSFLNQGNVIYMPEWLQLFEYSISQVISRCGVPVFFLTASVLFFKRERKFGDVFRNKVKTLLCPYLIWNTFWIVVFIVLQSMPFTQSYFSGLHTSIMEGSILEWLRLYGIGQEYPHCYPLWFMRDLMIVFLFFPIIKKIVNKYPYAMLAWGGVLTIISIHFPFKTALSWFIIGAVIVRKKIHMSIVEQLSLIKLTAIAIAGFLICILLNIDFIKDIYIYIEIILLIRISKYIYAHKTIRKKVLWLSEWTFIIYVFHELTLTSIKKLCLRLLPGEAIFLLMEYIFIPIFVIICCIILGIILKKTMFKLYVITTGGR